MAVSLVFKPQTQALIHLFIDELSNVIWSVRDCARKARVKGNVVVLHREPFHERKLRCISIWHIPLHCPKAYGTGHHQERVRQVSPSSSTFRLEHHLLGCPRGVIGY